MKFRYFHLKVVLIIQIIFIVEVLFMFEDVFLLSSFFCDLFIIFSNGLKCVNSPIVTLSFFGMIGEAIPLVLTLFFNKGAPANKVLFAGDPPANNF